MVLPSSTRTTPVPSASIPRFCGSSSSRCLRSASTRGGRADAWVRYLVIALGRERAPRPYLLTDRFPAPLIRHLGPGRGCDDEFLSAGLISATLNSMARPGAVIVVLQTF